jgi:hypothetical protein
MSIFFLLIVNLNFSVYLFRPQFYLTFWSLSMSDLQVPESAYKRRIQVLELEMTQIDDRKELVCLQSIIRIYIYVSFYFSDSCKKT